MKPIFNYQSIAKVIKKPVTTVIELVKFSIKTYNFSFKIHRLNRSKFTQHHIEYLVSSSTVHKQAHLSLANRAKLFHRPFDEKKISPSTIRRIYSKHKIRFKNIKRVKREIDFTEPHYPSLFNHMQSLLKRMHDSNTQVDIS